MPDTLAVMQPYFFPYIGYFQLIHAVDLFIYYDDVNYRTRSWIKRNRILVDGKPKYITIPCRDASQNKLIYEVEHALTPKKSDKVLKKLKFSYNKAPFYNEVSRLVKSVLYSNTRFISELAIKSVETCLEYLDIDTITKKSSEHYNNRSLDKADRLIDICHTENVSTYINAMGGEKLYDKQYFKEKGINLHFLKTKEIQYKQFGDTFQPNLSFIDVMMFNSPEKIKNNLLNRYKLD